jgi:hypothetical protein
MYAEGKGVGQDFVRAYMWASLASARGLKEPAEWREHLTQHMTPEQIAEAKKLAGEWRPSK